KVLNIALPRVRDFRGLSMGSFDKNNNYTMGIKEHIIFPEISYEKIEDIYGMQITVNTNAKTLNEAKSLLKSLGFPFKEKGQANG
ncbi:MAG: 50S ribosomal protein L5, partial [Bacteroidales bacterium]|nr:50S ribosomal protein L5 [Bacteroidales bacterium]